MSDICDNADKEIETNLALDLALQQRRATIVPPPNWDGETCCDCGELVTPRARLKLGYVNCLTCQETKERFRT